MPGGGSAGDLLTMQTPVDIETEYQILKTGAATHITYHLINEQGIVVLTSGCPSEVREPGVYRAVCTIPGRLINSGGYSLKLFVVENENQVAFELEGIAVFSVVDNAARDHACAGSEPGVVQPVLHWTTTCVRA